jgi:acyl-CoA synthetase (AMP-forming)/AMP-acid ligase II
VRLSHRNLVCNGIQCASASRIGNQDVLLLFLPFYHIYGTMLMGASVLSGATMCIMERFEMQTALSITERHRVTLFYAVPPVLLAMTQYPDLKRYDLSSVRYIMSGAAPLPPEIGRRMQELSGVRVGGSRNVTHMSRRDLIKMDPVGWHVLRSSTRRSSKECGPTSRSHHPPCDAGVRTTGGNGARAAKRYAGDIAQGRAGLRTSSTARRR